MSIFVRIILCMVAFGAVSCIVQSQSYDAGDGTPPSTHTLRTNDPPLISIFFEEKYRLLVDVDCKTDQLIVDVKLKGGSIANNINVVGDSVIYITLTPSGELRRQQISGNIMVSTSFKVMVNLDNDTAMFYVNYTDDNIDVSIAEESWFIESEPLLQLPRYTLWIISNDFKRMNIVKDSLIGNTIAQNIILKDGYYRCFPTGYVWEKHKRNECALGSLFVFKCKNESDAKQTERIIRDLMTGRAFVGSNL